MSVIHIVYKPDGKWGICLGPRNLNKAILYEHSKLPTREEVMTRMTGAKIFSKFNCSKGFKQLELEEKSSRLSSFITPEERSRYQRLSFGISSAPEIYHRTIGNMLEGMKNVKISVDHIVIWGPDIKSHLQTVKKVPDICKRNKVTLNGEKCQIAVTEWTFPAN